MTTIMNTVARAKRSATVDITNESSNSATLTTNVQVCARIRPLPTRSESKSREGLVKSSSPKKQLSSFSGGNYSSRRKPLGLSSTTSKTNGFHKTHDNDTFIAWDISDDITIAYQSSKTEIIQRRTSSYTLDKIFGADATTGGIYEESVNSLVKAAMKGYNSTVLAYGQTSTGKTHTMTGTPDDPGLIPLCISDSFKFVQDNASDEPREYLFRLSYLEIYKEHIRDLLSSATSAPDPVRLFDGPNGLVIRGLKEVVVSSPDKVFQLLKQGDKRRQVGATHMNQYSSRSHVVVRLKIESSIATNTSDETRVSILSLVDLAGSESVRLNGVERREEGQYINKSLMTLGQVVLSLSESCKTNGERKSGKNHIPYRDSKLTRLLQSSLSGNAQMLLMCCISPLASHLEESHNTFKFATRAKHIEQKASIQMTKDKDDSLLQTYRNEIEDLKKQLAEATEEKRQLLEEQRAFQTIKQHHVAPPEDINLDAVGTAMTISTMNSSSTNTKNNTVKSTDGEIKELVEAIQTMEELILKSRSIQQEQNLSNFHSKSTGNDPNNDGSLDLAQNNESLDRMLDRALGPEEPLTPQTNRVSTANSCIQSTPITESHLHSELSRVRGLLANVLHKRGVASIIRNDPPGIDPFGHEKVSKRLDFSTPSANPPPPPPEPTVEGALSEEFEIGINFDGTTNENFYEANREAEEKKAELESLRMELKKQERTTSLRKADSHFLQLQLEEKDKLLEEVSSLLEAVEKRQGELERENFFLKRELNTWREERGEEQAIIIRNTPFY